MAKKSFNIRSKELKINGVPNSNNLIREYLRGKKIEIIAHSNSHNYGLIGTILKVDGEHLALGGGAGNTFANVSGLTSGGNSIPFTCFRVIEIVTAQDLEEEITNLKAQKKELDQQIKGIMSKLAYLKEIGTATFDETEFKAYHTLSLLENQSLSKLEKSKLIAQLINN